MSGTASLESHGCDTRRWFRRRRYVSERQQFLDDRLPASWAERQDSRFAGCHERQTLLLTTGFLISSLMREISSRAESQECKSCKKSSKSAKSMREGREDTAGTVRGVGWGCVGWQ